MKEFSMLFNIKPVSKQRPRVTRYGTYTPKKTLEYENEIKTLYILNKGVKFDTYLEVTLLFGFEVPKSYTKKKRSDALDFKIYPHNDTDNLCKAVTDALNKVAYEDDKQIVKLIAEKFFDTEDSVYIKLKEI